LVMVGEDTTEGLEALKDALDKPVKASSTPTPALQIEANSGWFLADAETAQAFRKAVPGADPAGLKARLTVKGGKDLRLRLQMSANVLRAMALLGGDKPGQ